jgi:chromosome segregation ATPase
MPQQDLNELAKELKSLKDLFSKTKNDKARIEGRIDSRMEQLASHGLKNVPQAKKEIRRLKKETDEAGTEIFDRANDLQKRMSDARTG